jgi:hypothetical protein
VWTFEIYQTSFINVLTIAPPIAQENKDDKLHFYIHFKKSCIIISINVPQQSHTMDEAKETAH